ncbi:MAG TPA: arsinothricin resistance N-acetyltransferase ArsN1 family A [Caulobacteraceae bacterium]|jgi:phosphinothricin acetyltransferase
MNQTAFTVRPARLEDAAGVTEIYNQGIEDRIATFETRLRTVDEIRSWFDQPKPFVVVIDADGEVAGYAVSFEYADRCCYVGIGEFSVYVRRSHRGRGVGAVAMTALIEAATEAGYWKLLSRIFPENTASLALMQSKGFRTVGTHEKHGKLEGVWKDTVLVERLLEPNL